MKRAWLFLLGIAIVGACGPSDFDSATKLQTVRVLGVRADGDEAYAKPGDTVTLEALAVDARPTKPRPMTVYWLPYICQNPAGDLYAACFTPSAAGDAGSEGADAGGAAAGGGGIAGILQPGADISDLLPKGPTWTFTVPSDIIDRHKKVPGAPADYGLVIVFNVVCAGRVRIKPIDPSTGPQQVPLGCFDESGDELSPDDYVIGFTRVYVYNAITNKNPRIDAVVVDGNRTEASPDDHPAPVSITLPVCHGCAESLFDLDVPDTSSEQDPNDLGADGKPRREAVWVDWYATQGNVSGEAKLLYDAQAGRLGGTEMKYTPPDTPQDVTMYAVVHDNRDGITWVEIDLHVK